MITNKDQILSQVSIEDVIRDHGIELKRVGSNYQACCPFHEENTPSFTYSPARETFKCFGCGKGGSDAAAFLMHLGMTFLEAMQKIASMSNLSLEYDNTVDRKEYEQKNKEHKQLISQMRQAANDAYDLLKASHDASLGYAGKPWSDDIVQEFGITAIKYGPLAKSKIDKGLLNHLKLIKPKDAAWRDFYWNRVLYPIHDASGKYVISYAGRALDKGNKIKYLYTASHDLWKKSDILYNEHRAVESIANRGFCYVVEGVTDVIALAQIGVENVVAKLGSKLSEAQRNRLAQLTSHVVLLPDADNAGYESVMPDTQLLLKRGVQVSILFPRDGQDVADLIFGDAMTIIGWKQYSDDNSKDAIAYLVDQDLGESGSEWEKPAAVTTACNLIKCIDDPTLREQMIKITSKQIGVNQRTLKDAVKLQVKEQEDSDLSDQQEKDKKLYGIYVDGNRYVNANGIAISDFHLRGLYRINNDGDWRRIIELTTYQGKKHYFDIEQEELNTQSKFEKLFEGAASVLFWGDAMQYKQMRRRLYSSDSLAYQINTPGLHQRSGCYIYSNGIVTPEGKAIKSNEYGIASYHPVEGEPFHFYLPAFSKLQDPNIDRHGPSQLDKAFVYPFDEKIPKDCPSTMEEWSRDMATAWKDNSIVPICYLAASVYRDIVYDRFSSFPLLNIFGQSNVGKSQLADTLCSTFRKKVGAFSMTVGSDSAFAAMPEQMINAIAQYEEYRESLSIDRLEYLKGWFDGIGRIVRDITKGNAGTKRARVLSSIVFTGQALPTGDPALPNRCVSVEVIAIPNLNKEILELSDKLRRYAEKGWMVPVIADLHKRRSGFNDKFLQAVDSAKTALLALVDNPSDVKPRILNSYAILAATYMSMILDGIELPFNIDYVMAFLAKRIDAQMAYTVGSEEITHWWDAIQGLVYKGEIKDNIYSVEKRDSVNTIDKHHKWDTAKKVIYIHLPNCYYLYSGSKSVKNPHSKNLIKNYLTNSNAYLGTVKAHRCSGGGPTARLMAFDCDKLPGQDFAYTGIHYDQDESKNPFNPQQGMDFPDTEDFDPFA